MEATITISDRGWSGCCRHTERKRTKLTDTELETVKIKWSRVSLKRLPEHGEKTGVPFE
jgi:hypothetical protein